MALLRKVRAFIAKHWGFPSNAQWWWALLGLPAVPTLIAGAIAFVREASWLVLGLIVVGSYLLAFAATVVFLPRWFPQRANHPASQPASENKQPEANNKWLQETQGKLTPLANRRLLKRALTEAYKEGLRLSQMRISEEEAAPWALRTAGLIKAALEDQKRAQHFIEAEYKSITDLNQTKGQIWVEGCLNELYELLREVDSLKPLKLRPGFDGREWVSKQ